MSETVYDEVRAERERAHAKHGVVSEQPTADYDATAELLRRHVADEPLPPELVPVLDGLVDLLGATLAFLTRVIPPGSGDTSEAS